MEILKKSLVNIFKQWNK